ncbi:hypothetical protein [Amycolatopsis sp. NPDC051071]|uniref:hypothetical protein n=1 Tax=Amycolatopsis sp. NPDC051071 TaxID=3154637 RepID=UPI0034326BE4
MDLHSATGVRVDDKRPTLRESFLERQRSCPRNSHLDQFDLIDLHGVAINRGKLPAPDDWFTTATPGGASGGLGMPVMTWCTSDTSLGQGC